MFDFLPSTDLVKKINKKACFRIDVTPTEMPKGPGSPFSVKRAKESIQIRLDRMMGNVAWELISIGREFSFLTDGESFSPDILPGVRQRLNLDSEKTDNLIVQLATELQEWLKEKGGFLEYKIGPIKALILENGRIKLVVNSEEKIVRLTPLRKRAEVIFDGRR